MTRRETPPKPTPSASSGSVPQADECIRLLHLTTAPESLRFLAGQARHMRSWGIEMHALSSPGDELTSFAARESVEPHAVPMQRRITPLRDLLAVFRIWRVLRTLRPQIVHAHTPKAGLLGMIAAWFARVPVRIYHVHGLRFMTCSGWKRWVLRSTERIACLLSHRVLCVSTSVRAVAIAEGICPADQIRVLLQGSINGVDVERFRPADEHTRAQARSLLGLPPDAFVVGFIGRVARDKGVIKLADAWQMIRVRFADVHLLVVGPVEPFDPVPDRVLSSLRSDPRVTLRLQLDWNTPTLYAAMDLFVLPSYREGFPISPLEAAALGLPVLATRIPGCVDAVGDGITGTLVSPGDAAALAEGIARYRSDAQLRRRHGEAGRARVLRDFRQEAVWQATRTEYTALLAERGVSSCGRSTSPHHWAAVPSELPRGER